MKRVTCSLIRSLVFLGAIVLIVVARQALADPAALSTQLLEVDDAARAAFEKEHPGVLPEQVLRARLPLPSAAAFNWCDLNQDFFVYNQGDSGSCWAESSIEALECSWLIRNGRRLSFSAQPILDYTKRDNGGNGDNAFDVMLNHGTALLEKYPFTGHPQPVRTNVATPFRAVAWGQVAGDRRPTRRQIKTALLEHGPLVVSLFASPAFMAYKGGVLSDASQPAAGQPPVGHIVLLLGWDNNRGKAGAWRIKNSWGKNWGEEGYCWIEYGADNLCYTAFWVRAQCTYYPLPKNQFLKCVPQADAPQVWRSPIAAIATITSVRTEANVAQGSQQCLRFHVAGEAGRAKDKTLYIDTCLLDSNGKPMRTRDGQAIISARTRYTPPSDSVSFKDVCLSIPYDSLPGGAAETRCAFLANISCGGCILYHWKGNVMLPARN